MDGSGALRSSDPTEPLQYSAYFCKEISNSAQVYSLMLKNNETLDYLLISPRLLYDLSLLAVAINKSFLSRGSLRTRSLKTEILYNLSPSTNITDSLRRFGFNPQAENAVLVVFADSPSFPPIECVFGTEADYLEARDVASTLRLFEIPAPEEEDRVDPLTVMQSSLVVKDL